MNTPAHLLIGAAVFGKVNQKGTTIAALFGALTPDLSLYVMVSASIWVLNISPAIVFDELYFSDAWQRVFAIDNSFILWGLACAVAVWRRSAIFTAFTAAALLHLALDFPSHTDDARMHFWPVTNWVFESPVSPVSYWDRRAYAGVVGPFEVTLSCGAAFLIWRRNEPRLIMVIAAFLLAADILSSGIWQFIF
ncbi:MAG: cobalamin biosynthesis protein CobQ [Boseongicola sp.]